MKELILTTLIFILVTTNYQPLHAQSALQILMNQGKVQNAVPAKTVKKNKAAKTPKKKTQTARANQRKQPDATPPPSAEQDYETDEYPSVSTSSYENNLNTEDAADYIIGNWVETNQEMILSFAPNGGFSIIVEDVVIYGTWQLISPTHLDFIVVSDNNELRVCYHLEFLDDNQIAITDDQNETTTYLQRN